MIMVTQEMMNGAMQDHMREAAELRRQRQALRSRGAARTPRDGRSQKGERKSLLGSFLARLRMASVP